MIPDQFSLDWNFIRINNSCTPILIIIFRTSMSVKCMPKAVLALYMLKVFSTDISSNTKEKRKTPAEKASYHVIVWPVLIISLFFLHHCTSTKQCCCFVIGLLPKHRFFSVTTSDCFDSKVCSLHSNIYKTQT